MNTRPILRAYNEHRVSPFSAFFKLEYEPEIDSLVLTAVNEDGTPFALAGNDILQIHQDTGRITRCKGITCYLGLDLDRHGRVKHTESN